jgi:hypothetical protein
MSESTKIVVGTIAVSVIVGLGMVVNLALL